MTRLCSTNPLLSRNRPRRRTYKKLLRNIRADVPLRLACRNNSGVTRSSGNWDKEGWEPFISRTINS